MTFQIRNLCRTHSTTKRRERPATFLLTSNWCRLNKNIHLKSRVNQINWTFHLINATSAAAAAGPSGAATGLYNTSNFILDKSHSQSSITTSSSSSFIPNYARFKRVFIQTNKYFSHAFFPQLLTSRQAARPTCSVSINRRQQKRKKKQKLNTTEQPNAQSKYNIWFN